MSVPEAHGDYIGWAIGIAGMVIGSAIGIYAILDVRKVKSRLQRVVDNQDGMLKQIRGFLLGMKPSVNGDVQHQINDQLEYLKKLEASIKAESGR